MNNELLLNNISNKYPTKYVHTVSNTPALNEYGRLITHYIDVYIICERCRKCGWIPIIHGEDDSMYEKSCKGRHSWGKEEILVASGSGLSECSALNDMKINNDNIPLEYKKNIELLK